MRQSGNKYIKNWDFTFQFAEHGQCNVTMTAVVGHITSLDFPAQFGWGKCNPGQLFGAPIVEKVPDDKRSVAQNIANEARGAAKLMIWTDCDREGEYIGWEILQAARQSNTALTEENTWRAQFSHLETQHVCHAAAHPVRLDRGAIDAVRARMEVDLRTGASFSRFLTEGMKRRLRGELNQEATLSYGLCQFPTLGFVCDRYTRVRLFVPEPFWYLELETRKERVKTVLSWARTRVFDRLVATVIFRQCMQLLFATVTHVATAPTSKWRPLPLTTVELQKNCARYFKMSGKAALDAAEQLYLKGFVSYPRTETDSFPRAMDLRKLVQRQTQSAVWGAYATELGNGKFSDPRVGKHDDKAHPPIHPVVFTDGSGLSASEKKVYEYIVRHFLACCSQDAKGSQTTVTLQWGPEKFSASGLTVLERNFLDVFPYVKWASSKVLPQFVHGEEVALSRAELKSGVTAPPQHMTEPELIALMDANGIGTDATIADHIEKVLAREYVVKVAARSGALFVPSELGMALVKGFDAMLEGVSLTKPFLRKELECDLGAVVAGRKTKDAVLATTVEKFRAVFAVCASKQAMLVASYREVIKENQ
ncbi:hypothetical protein BABINDRAFT_160475 [Babjeviella inositovora NRRL Y-12698]|uniref:DNA topoisomerase n=1 Tax=Babjeviella inositovora NRRL Y-12698 TaxID=984486 RepID=A0A1E3QTP6_9ASCO|nr:uncharacterized protein BABINDRAFT_160475 [Babjeviella inositovora NRRL Y-12698]ODQ81058.1 hypothetical protein BABINDRAFT_160475 [Babjeviella inositovora NRRL Y-12698]